jgi:CBS domain-containing protein
MFVKEVLQKKGSDVFTVQPRKLVDAAIAAMRERRIGSAVVVDRHGMIEGIISERDIVYGIARLGAEALRMPVASLMIAPPLTCTPDDDLTSVMRLMTRWRLRHVPVVIGDQLCGIISIGDVVKHRLDEIELEVNVLRDYARLTAHHPAL